MVQAATHSCLTQLPACCLDCEISSEVQQGTILILIAEGTYEKNTALMTH